MRRDDLAVFLRRRRELLRPRDVGLVEGPRRRTRGLRREEVAALAGMSTNCYTRLEQRRGPRPSVQIAASMAHALRLTLDERVHLFVLMGHDVSARSHHSEHVSPALLRVLDRLHDTPALVLSDLADTLAQNPLAVALLGDQTHYTGLARSAHYRWFTGPSERACYPEEDHGRHSHAQAARLRAALTNSSDAPRAARIVADLRRRSPEFVRVWEQQETTRRYDENKTFLHPELGHIDVDVQVLITDNRTQSLVILTARPGTESNTKLELLSVIGHRRFIA